MSGAGHTPSPWRAERGQRGDTWSIMGTVPSGSVVVAKAVWTKADADLLAAAPALLAALRDMIHLNDHGDPEGASRRLHAARAALAKAEGREP